MTKRAKKSKIPIYRLEKKAAGQNCRKKNFRNAWGWLIWYLKSFQQPTFWPYKTVTLLYFPTMRAMNRQDENVGLYTHTNKDLHFSGLEIYEWRYTLNDKIHIHICVLKTTLLPPSVRQKSSGKKKMKKKSIFFSTILIRLEGNTRTLILFFSWWF